MRPLESGGRCLVPRLLAVNVGLPKDVPWRGSTVHTGIWKQPVAGPRMVRRLNIDGDGQGDLAGHGGEHRAVLVYQIASYGYWQEQLGRDDFSYGQFGENFTIEGMADDEVCIGDCYRIGEAEFEVTQPRVTCYRVGLRMDEPRMAALLVAHGRPGFYLRVRTEGRVEAGNEIVKVASGPQRMTVAEMSALLYLPGHARQELARALTIPELSPGWKTSLRALLDQADGEQGRATGNSGLTTVAGGPPPAWAGFRPLRVVGVDAESRDVFSVRLASGDTAPLPTALPGQFLTLRLHPRVDGPPVIRSYSLSGRPGDANYGSAWNRGRTARAAAPCGPISAPATPSRSRRREAPSPWPPATVRCCYCPPASAPPRCWRCCTRWPPSAPPARCGGCTGPATAASIPSRVRPAPCSPACRTRTLTSATAGPARTTARASTTQPPAGCPPTCSTSSSSRGPPTPTCAARPRSCGS